MGLSTKSIELLIDLLEIRISALMIQDQEDAKELSRLKKCKSELEKAVRNANLEY